MEKQNIIINIPTAEAAREIAKHPVQIILREGQAAKVLDEKEPVKIDIDGTIDAVAEFLGKRMEDINTGKAHIIVNRQNVSITLVINEDDPLKRGKVVGRLQYDERFLSFGINKAEALWQPMTLAMHMKMNRSFFPNADENRSYVTTLMNYRATIEQNVDKFANERGDRRDNFEQIVNSNLPAAFHLCIPIFKGRPKENIEVETFAQVNGRDVSFVLLSPGANDTLEAVRDSEIDAQLNAIRGIIDEDPIPIIEV